MAIKTKIIDGVTVVSNKDMNLSYGFKRTGPNIVAVTTAICAADDKFKHSIGREIILNRFDQGAIMNLRIPSNLVDNETTATIVDEMIYRGNI